MTATATTATVYQVSVHTFVPFDGEYFVAYYASSVAAAQRLLVAAVEANGWAMDDYEVTQWNGTSATTIRKAINDSIFYSFDCGHNSGKNRVLIHIEAVQPATDGYRGLVRDRLAFAAECATALATGELATLTARETRKKATYPAKPEPVQTMNTTELSAYGYATLNVHPESAYGRYNGQRLEVREVLNHGQRLALVIPGNNGNSADFNLSEVLDYTPANAELVDYKISGLDEVAIFEKHTAAVNQINRALAAGQVVFVRSADQDEDRLVESAQIFPERGTNLPRLRLVLADTTPQPNAIFDRIIIQLPAALEAPVEEWRANLPERLKEALVAAVCGESIQEASLTIATEEAHSILDAYSTQSYPLGKADKANRKAVGAWLDTYRNDR